ncbi:MAG: hypothetical protein HFJ84_05985 [Clostridiales bacterium]|jgi:DNA invertase Pin-like site-specific DNA recombinase|nr:hypothetical protein [Clostridiales bacterium]
MVKELIEEKLKQIELVIDDSEKYQQVLTIIYEIEALLKSHKAKRQADGIAAAKERGVKFGRPQKPLPRKFKKIYECYQLGLITAAEAATCLETNRVSFKRMVERYEQENRIALEETKQEA